MQNYTSKNTSVNSKKVPAIYKSKAAQKYLQHAIVLDYGCGKYDIGMNYASDKYDATVFGYDPYNRSEEYNKVALDLRTDYDVCVSSNVLNVIDSTVTRMEIIQHMASKAPVLLFTVYEGDKSGIGKQTKKDCWQNNRVTEDYLVEIQRALNATGYDWNVERKGKLIIAEEY